MESVLSLPPEPDERPREYEAFLFWLQNGKVKARVCEQMGVSHETVRRWSMNNRWEERAMEFETKRGMVPYSKEQAVNDLMSGYALSATEIVITSAMDDYNAMVALWRSSIQDAAEKDGGLSGKELRDFFAARDVLDQMGRRIARLPAAFKSTVSPQGNPDKSIADKHVDDEISWN